MANPKKKLIAVATALALLAIFVRFLFVKYAHENHSEIAKRLIHNDDATIYKDAQVVITPPDSEFFVVNLLRGGVNQVIIDSMDRVVAWIAPATYLIDRVRQNNSIRLKGQAFLEVKSEFGKGKKEKPIIIYVTNNLDTTCSISILSGVINICAYPDDSLVVATLIEGKAYIKFSNKRMFEIQRLPIGQKALLQIEPDGRKNFGQRNKDTPFSSDIDIARSIKQGVFEYKDEQIEPIMRMFSRLYNVKVAYQDKIDRLFTGKMKFKSSQSDFIKNLESTGWIRFRYDSSSNTVYVMKAKG